MERMLSPHGIKFEHQHMIQRRRCSICGRKLEQTAFYLTEGDDAPEPQQAWLLCAPCNTAVQAELSRSELQSHVRTRVAVGIVASSRSPANRAKWWQERFWDELDDRDWNRLIIWFIMFVAFAHVGFFLLLVLVPLIFHLH
jgi:uncharacterized protein with PIN domain